MQGQPEGKAGAAKRRDTASSGDLSVVPADLKVKIGDQRLFVDWQDGHRSEYPLAQLRRNCPCATCRTDREEQAKNPLQILKADPAGVRVTHAELVGHYAIRFHWSDGHSAGIFDFRLLRRLDVDPS